MFSIQTVMNLIYEHLFTITVLVVFFSLFRNLINFYLQRKQLPSGPIGLPFVGYLPFLGKAPHKKIAKLSDKYGNVFTLPLGMNNIVLLNDFEAVKNAFSKESLSGRPHNPLFTILDEETSFADDSGPVWRDHRRFSIQLLRDLGFGKGSMEDKIVDEISYLTDRIDEIEGKPVNIRAILTPSMSNNISQLVFGHRLETDDPKRVKLDKMIDAASGTFSPTGAFYNCPIWLRNMAIRIGSFSNKKAFEDVFKIFDDEISSHQKNFNKNKLDYIDGYLDEMKLKIEKDPNTSFTVPKLHANSFGLFGAGSETVRTTTEWCLLIASHYTDFQNRVQTEIDSVVGKQRCVYWADRLRMPFTQAFICEVLRWKTSVPINLYRRATENTTILNHFIPKDTLVLANLWAVHNDPKIWSDPDQFNPNRFLSNDGKELIKTEYLIPFSIGKRSCAGESLARVEVFLYFATLLQKYTLSAVNAHMKPFEEKIGLSLQPLHNPLLSFEKRI